MVIEQHPAPNYSLLAPRADSVDIAARLAIRPVNIIERDAVIEHFFFLVAEVAQAVPLRGGLGVEGPDVVVDDARRFLVKLLVEGLAAEEGKWALGVAINSKSDKSHRSLSAMRSGIHDLAARRLMRESFLCWGDVEGQG